MASPWYIDVDDLSLIETERIIVAFDWFKILFIMYLFFKLILVIKMGRDDEP
jgi:hypothetical protein